MAALTADGLTRRFGDRVAADGLTFEIPSGGLVGFVGPNGSGKSTTIRMLLGLISPSAGTGTVLGEPIERPERFADRVGALIENPAFLGSLSGRDNLRSFAALRALPPGRVDAVLETVRLNGRGDDKASSYSLGMKQRLGIAAALLPDPDLLVLDEPTNGLDPAGIVEIRELLKGLVAGGRTVVDRPAHAHSAGADARGGLLGPYRRERRGRSRTIRCPAAPGRHPMRNVVRSELIRIWRPSFLLGGLGVMVVAAGLVSVFIYTSAHDMPPASGPTGGPSTGIPTAGQIAEPGGFMIALSTVSGLAGLVLLVIWAMAVANDYHSGLIRIIVQAEPRRAKLLAGKLIALLLFTLVATVHHPGRRVGGTPARPARRHQRARLEDRLLPPPVERLLQLPGRCAGLGPDRRHAGGAHPQLCPGDRHRHRLTCWCSKA
jgi:ABC-type Na+ transport system ATPase subunit NatA